MKYIILAVAIVLLSACGSQKKVIVAKPKVLPSWYTNPPKSNSSDLYALGEGKNQKEAVAEALAAMVSTLSVSIASSFNAKTVVREGTINSSTGTYTSDIQSDVKKIRISNYEIVSSKTLGFKRYAVLVKSNKKRLFQSMKQELNQEFLVIDAEKKSIRNTNALKQLDYYRKKLELLKNLPNTLIVMSGLDEKFDGELYIRKAQNINTSYQDIVQNISFYISANSDAKNLKAPISKGISEKHYKIKNVNGKMHFNIYINSKIEKAKAYGFTLARSEIKITTKDYKGGVIGSNILNIVGQSSQGFAIAKQDLVRRLNKLIQKDGISKVLGLSI